MVFMRVPCTIDIRYCPTTDKDESWVSRYRSIFFYLRSISPFDKHHKDVTRFSLPARNRCNFFRFEEFKSLKLILSRRIFLTANTNTRKNAREKKGQIDFIFRPATE